VNGQPQAAPPEADGQPPAARPPANQQGRAPEVPTPVAVPPAPDGQPVQLSAAKAAALQQVNSALDEVREAQRSGNFAEYGEALQRLDDAMTEYQSAR
jgi:uncharacterized protein